jgi:hypothetical protein
MISTAVLHRFLPPLLLFTTCTMLDPGGSGTETTTGIVGAVVNDQGVPQTNVQVQLFPEAYNPVRDAIAIPADTTESQGRYAFMNIRDGNYTILAVHLVNRTRALVSGIHVASDTVIAAPGTLRTPGSILVSLPTETGMATGYVYIPGTTVFVLIDDRADFVVLDSAPAGFINEIAYAPTGQANPGTIRYNISVASNDTTFIWNPSWKNARALGLNTSKTGANIAGNAVNFPALIRLNEGNLDFSQAQPDGADIRFTKADNTFLDYEIDRWDAAAKTAEIWVKIDTVHGNDSTQTLMMYWGNAAAQNASNGAAVFDTSAGFQGVWHFRDGPADPVRDATANGYYGMSPDNARPHVEEGVAGNCRVFDGNTDYITMPNTANSTLNFPEDGHFTVSAWVYLDTFDFVYRTIAAKGYEQYYLRFTSYPSAPLWEFAEFDRKSTWQSTTHPATERQWVFLTGVRDGRGQYLFYNGELVDSTIKTYSNELFSRDESNDLSIGRFLKEVTFPTEGGYCFFKGKIDEVRISGQARSRDWIRLSYMNQRSDDRLVK